MSLEEKEKLLFFVCLFVWLTVSLEPKRVLLDERETVLKKKVSKFCCAFGRRVKAQTCGCDLAVESATSVGQTTRCKSPSEHWNVNKKDILVHCFINMDTGTSCSWSVKSLNIQMVHWKRLFSEDISITQIPSFFRTSSALLHSFSYTDCTLSDLSTSPMFSALCELWTW